MQSTLRFSGGLRVCPCVCVCVCVCVWCMVTGGQSTHRHHFLEASEREWQMLEGPLAFDPLHVSSKASPCAAEAAGVPANSTASPQTVPRRRSEGSGPQSSEAHPCTLVSSDLGQTPLPARPVAWETAPRGPVCCSVSRSESRSTGAAVLVHLQRLRAGFRGAATP